jgi:ADP-ribose pyrophosphatase YjhB (NUDIX family)
MQHCPKCGAPTTVTIPEGDNFARDVCTVCRHVIYANPVILVACILYDENRVLWIKRSTEPYAGRWAIPAGFMECSETIRETACRELVEETRIVVQPQSLSVYGVFSIPEINQVYVSLVAPLPSRNFEVTAEASDIALLTAKEAKQLDFAYPSQTLPFIWGLYAQLDAGTLGAARTVLADIREGSVVSRAVTE